MYATKQQPSDPSQQWTVHAQFTISHDGLPDTNQPPQAHTEQDENGVRMVYTWSSQDTPQKESYGFQKSNMVFTSTPPQRKGDDKGDSNGSSNRLGVDSSGYGSEMLSPNNSTYVNPKVMHMNNANLNAPQNMQSLQNRRCRSTCSIVLSTNVTELKPDDPEAQSQGSTSRTHSLRCQTPTLRCDQRSGCGKDAFYGCGDPWCYHSNFGDDVRFSPVPEGEEYMHSKRPSRASTYSAHQERSRSSPPRLEKSRDAAVQTYEMIDKCTSPFLRMDSFDFKNARATNNKDYRERNLKKRGVVYNARRRTEPIYQRAGSSASSLTPDSLDSTQKIYSKRIPRNPVPSGSKLTASKEVKNSNTDTSNNSSDPNKKPRTVHIDVYCTGTELDSDSSSSESDTDEKTGSSPQTVYESGKVRITHKRSKDDLPFHMQNMSMEKETKKEQSPDIGEGLSSGYPSRSSFSGLGDSRDFGSSFCSSVPPSWSTMSLSVPDVPDDESHTSWKDTNSDLGSWSRSSLAQTDSLDFVPRKMASQLNATRTSIDEQPEIDLLRTPSIQMSDSFEYANSEDKYRINRMENLWQQQQRLWKSPQIERKHHLQQQKMREYFEKKLGSESTNNFSAKEDNSDSDNSDGSEKGWSFVKNDDRKLERESTIKKTNKDLNIVAEDNNNNRRGAFVVDESTKVVTACKSPSILIIKQKMSLNPSLRAPFTLLPGVFTEQREIAKKFGRIVDVFKKPGHHIGPAKNPDCTCDHCREYFQKLPARNRARSVDSHYNNYYNWKNTMRNSMPHEDSRTLPAKKENKSVTNLGV